jgi:hypothetical protein
MPRILLWLLILAPERPESMSDDDIVSLDDIPDRGCEDLQIVDMKDYYISVICRVKDEV